MATASRVTSERDDILAAPLRAEVAAGDAAEVDVAVVVAVGVGVAVGLKIPSVDCVIVWVGFGLVSVIHASLLHR